MAYVKQNWENLPSTNTPITAERLNHMEDGIAEAWEHGGGGAGETLKIGTILPYTGSNSELPTGYMLCDGSELSRTEYSDLFAVIGTSFGAGNGSSTFNLPNLKGKVLTGLDSNDEDFASMGATGGEKEHTLTVSEMPAHSHGGIISGAVATNGGGTGWTRFTGTSAPSNTGSTGDGQAHNILQPYVVVNYIIKVTQSAPIQAQIVGTYSESAIDGYSCNYVNNVLVDEYSTNEIKTNKKWIDNKPIYRKVFEFATPTSSVNSWTTLASVSGLDIETVTTLEGTYREENANYFHPINYYESSTAYFLVMVLGNNLAYKKASGGATTFYSKIILEYTKTTD